MLYYEQSHWYAQWINENMLYYEQSHWYAQWINENMLYYEQSHWEIMNYLRNILLMNHQMKTSRTISLRMY